MAGSDLIAYVNGAAVRKVWTMEMIRSEIRRLDQLTGLHGADIPCEFRPRMHCVLGRFTRGKPGQGEAYMKFEFSLPHFSDVTRPGSETSKLDTVRHEYAHYYAWVKYGETGHGRLWKHACGVVGCSSQRCEDREEMRAKEEREAPYVSVLRVGDLVEHPSYGLGEVKEIRGYQHTAVLTAIFEDGITRRIDELWLLRNGKTSLEGPPR